ncbi:TonB-dependent receptor [Paludisphaera mucosa]|uniref:TonB-dependent receptor n=1 Tax=Paludisphaera mucosa TaxID=3030827 RepID=A0ABT6F3V6_9BACT|nr:TonB-dependent receptor [Paludisphaera mucosa]MDG3002229.1 TonB-dependent receptor [Paludisphaera mucosa]
MEPKTDRKNLVTQQKALAINLDPRKYGTFAEIGAGQEVVRWFFQVGGAAGTIAKSISAYDMTVSDAIYGPSSRYVSRDRLQTMLDYEYALLQERLQGKRGADTDFFVFADTVSARNFQGTNECHGWMGIKYQATPGAEPCQIVVHVRMLDKDNVSQQQALGIIGVNLIYAALYHFRVPDDLMNTLIDDLNAERIEVDMIKFSGPEFRTIDHRLMSLKLVQLELSDAAMFAADGEVLQPSEVLYKKPILVERGSFRPVTHVNLDMLQTSRQQFLNHVAARQGGAAEPEVVSLMELTMRNLRAAGGENGDIDYDDFLARADVLAATGATVLISDYFEYYRLASYLRRYTKSPIGITMGIPSLIDLFDEKYYDHLEGGILESFGRLFRNDLKLFVYPLLDATTRQLVTVQKLKVAPSLQGLYDHLAENGYIESIDFYNKDYLRIFSRDVLRKITDDDPSWEAMVPPTVASLIKERRLFGYHPLEQPRTEGGAS